MRNFTSTKQELLNKLLEEEGLQRTEDRISERPLRDPAPLSFEQSRLWFLEAFDAGGAAYNMHAGFDLEGPVDADALERAFHGIIRRHRILCSHVEERDGEPVQFVDDVDAFVLRRVDLSGLPPEARSRLVDRHARNEAQSPFDLSTGPLLRARLLRCGPDSHVLLVTMHHIVSDEWSVDILVRELAEHYRAAQTGDPPELPELPIQYTDYAAWQREERFTPDVVDAHLDFWRDHLDGAPQVLDLPLDHPRPEVQTFRGDVVSLSVPDEVGRGLRSYAESTDSTLFMTLLAAYQVLLARFSNQNDFVVGTPVANRERPEVEHLIGFFVNTLPIRADLCATDGDDARLPSFRTLVDRVRRRVEDALDHQSTPFGRIVESVTDGRDPSIPPLFQTMFVLNRSADSSASLETLDLTWREPPEHASKVDLSLYVDRSESGLDVRLHYNVDLFDAETIEAVGQCFLHLLRVLPDSDDVPVSRIPLLPDALERTVLEEWSGARVSPTSAGTVHAAIEAQADATPDAPALVDATSDAGEVVSYGALDARANRLARHLHAEGVGRGDQVALLLERGPRVVDAVLAVWKLGAAYVPLDPAYPTERLAYVLEDAAVSALVTSSAAGDVSGARPDGLSVPCVDLDADRDAIDRRDASAPSSRVHPSDLAYVLYTSGSTGAPKGVSIEHRAARRLVDWAGEEYGDTLDGVLAGTSVCFDLSVFELFAPLASGGTVLLAESMLDAGDAWRRARAAGHPVTLVNTVPSVMSEVLAAGSLSSDATGAPLDGVHVNLAGEPLRPSLVDRLYDAGAEQVTDLYGPSEETTYATRAPRRYDGPETIGTPLPGTQVYVLDAHLQPVAPGGTGELYLGGGKLARGYAGRPRHTATHFVPHPFADAPGRRLYRTGDLVQWRPDGQLAFVGRSDRQVKVHGYRIELGEVEAAFDALADVDRVAVVAAGTGADRHLAAFVVTSASPDDDVLPDRLRRSVGTRLPEYEVPSSIDCVASLPQLPNGKVDRDALRDRAAQHSATPNAASGVGGTPRPGVESTLADVWREVLDVDDVGRADDFFHVGGHSLTAMRLVSRIQDTFDVSLPVREVFSTSTLQAMADRIEQATSDDAATASAIPSQSPEARASGLPLTFGQQRLWFLSRLDPGSAVYNVSGSHRLHGPLDEDALRAAVASLVRRHGSLRTRFILDDDGAPRQTVPPSDECPPQVPTVDLSALPPDARERAWTRVAETVGTTPFDLETGPLFRAVLVTLDDDAHGLALATHHIVCDGWSIPLLHRDLAAFYAHHIASDDAPADSTAGGTLPRLPVQYADVAAWQRERITRETLDDDLAYWHDQLDGVPPLRLPTDRDRPTVQSFAGDTVAFAIDDDVADALRRLSRDEDVTPFVTLLAAFQVLLHRFSQQDDFAVGTPLANRNRAETEPLIGLLINTLVLRADMSRTPSFRDVLHRVHQTTLDAFDHKDVPFEWLVDDLVERRDLSRHPLYQVMFMMQGFESFDLDLPGVEATRHDADGHAARFDLTLAVREVDDAWTGLMEFNTDLFDRSTVEGLASAFRTLLRSAAASPDDAVSTLPLLDADARERLLDLGRPAPTAFEVRPIHRLIERQVEQTPDAPAVVTGVGAAETRWSYRELDARSNRIARHLRARGVEAGDRVGLLVERSPDLVATLLAIWKTGAAYVPLDPAYPAERLRYILDDSQSAALVTSTAIRTQSALAPAIDAFVESGRPVVDLTDEAAGIDARDADPLDAPLAPADAADRLAYVIYTSGSTGRPKGVKVTHRNVANFFSGMDERIPRRADASGPGAQDTWLSVTTISFDISVLELTWTLARGFKVVLHVPPAGEPASGSEANARDASTDAPASDASGAWTAASGGDGQAGVPETPSVSQDTTRAADSAAAAPSAAPDDAPDDDAPTMDFGLFYFASAAGSDEDVYRLLIEGARYADAHGFSSVWTPERHFHDFGGLYAHPSVTGAAVAQATETVDVRAGSVVLPLHDPIRVAETWSMIDNLSGGRTGVSFASGWHSDDFVMAPQVDRSRTDVFANRKDVMFERIQTVRTLWRGQTITRPGVDDDPVDLSIHPKPVQDELPIWITSGGNPETFERAGFIGANLLTHLLGQDVDDLKSKIDGYRAALRKTGRNPDDFTVTVMLHTFVHPDDDFVRSVVREPFTNYLRSSLGLMNRLAQRMGHDASVDELSEAEIDTLLDYAFDRYYASSGLMGTPQKALGMVRKLTEAGIDEIGCLIDFGVPTDTVLDSLPHLNRLRRWCSDDDASSGTTSDAVPLADSAPRAASTASAPSASTSPSASPPASNASISALIRAHEVTHLQCTPSQMQMLQTSGDDAQAVASLDTVLLGGETLPVPLAVDLLSPEAPPALHNMYGPTEATIWATTEPVTPPVDDGVSIGRPIANTPVYVLDAEMNPVPEGVWGELYVGGEAVVPGYSHRPRTTATSFVPDPHGEPGARLYRTGDRVRWQTDGRLDFGGRFDHQVKVRGHRVELGEIEAALNAVDGVRESAVALEDDAMGSTRLAAFVVPTDDAAPERTPPSDPAAASSTGDASPTDDTSTSDGADGLSPDRRERVGDRPVYTLPDGRVIAHQTDIVTRNLYDEVVRDNVYFRHGITLPDDACVVDVGANIGMFSLLADRVASEARVLAFEPIPGTHDVLQANFDLHDVDGRAFRCGLADESGSATFTHYPNKSGMSSRYADLDTDKQIARSVAKDWLQDEDGVAPSDAEVEALIDQRFERETYDCELRTLSDVLNTEDVDRVDLLKIDVEGAELDVLRGISEADWDRIEQVVMEVDTPDLLEGVTALLDEHGFHVHAEDLVRVEEQDGIPGVAVFALYASRTPLAPGAELDLRAVLPEDPDRSSGSRSDHADAAAPSAASTPLTASQLRTALEARLPEYMVPSLFAHLDDLPRTPNGKIDRGSLPAAEAHRLRSDVAYESASTGVQAAVLDAWTAVLPVDDVGVHDNFFELGGTSILIAQVHGRLQRQFGDVLSLVDLFQHPTVASLAAHLKAMGVTEPGGEGSEPDGAASDGADSNGAASDSADSEDEPDDAAETSADPEEETASETDGSDDSDARRRQRGRLSRLRRSRDE